MTPLIKEMTKLVPSPEDSIWFDIGELDDHQKLEVDPDLLTHLPFKEIGIVCSSPDKQKFQQKYLLWAKEVDYADMKTITATGFVLTPDFIKLPALFIGSRDNKLYLATKDSKTGKTVNASLTDDNARVCVILQCLLKRLEQNKVTAFEPTIVDSFTNKRRIAKKKSPLITWRTVVVEPKPKSDYQGGTHASPRAHERRGHWRQLKTKKVWVKSCKVGKPSNGIVFHDYKVPDISKPKAA